MSREKIRKIPRMYSAEIIKTIEQAAEFAILQEMMANDDVENENVSTATLQLRTTD